MTAYIVQVTGGDAELEQLFTYSFYAVGITLFVFTLLMNLLAHIFLVNSGRNINMKYLIDTSMKKRYEKLDLVKNNFESRFSFCQH